jgi:tRNA 2-thiouridine synthesizing protein E
MMTNTILETVELNEEGFMIEPNAWTKEIAIGLAKEEGIDDLTDTHWKIIDFCRQKAADTGNAPTLRAITKGSGITTKELFTLFPKGPSKKVAKISGLGKPEGCV